MMGRGWGREGEHRGAKKGTMGSECCRRGIGRVGIGRSGVRRAGGPTKTREGAEHIDVRSKAVLDLVGQLGLLWPAFLDLWSVVGWHGLANLDVAAAGLGNFNNHTHG